MDVLDEQAVPATDYLMPGGLSRDELAELTRPLLASPGLAGVSLACYNPDKDPAEPERATWPACSASCSDPGSQGRVP